MATGNANSADSSNTITQEINKTQSDFHDALLTKVLVQYVPSDYGHIAAPSTISKLPKDAKWPWRRFLDLLCGLCCSQPGGDDVVSIAVEDCSDDESRFWLATSVPRFAEQAMNHLRRLFRLLGEAGRSQEARLRNIAQMVCSISVQHAARRVAQYRRKLQRPLKALKAQLDQGSAEDGPKIYEALRTVATSANEDAVLMASAFLQEPIHQTLSRLADDGDSIYIQLRHFVGRLSFWYTAACQVTRLSIRFSRIINAAEIVAIDAAQILDSPIKIPKDITTAYQRVFGTNHPMAILWGDLAAQAGRDLGHSQKLLENFKERDQIPIVHAEAAVAHFFCVYRLVHMDLDPYVACSKPSCDACAMYMRTLSRYYKNRTFVPRPYHGNAWLQWTIPMAHAKVDMCILRDMAAEMQRDVAELLRGKKYANREFFESTTGNTGLVLEV